MYALSSKMKITEPVTLATDYILGAAGAAFAAGLWKSAASNRASLLWLLGFAAGAIAAFVGGTFHGFALHMTEATRRSLWNVTLLSIGASAAFMISGALSDPRSLSSGWLKGGLLLSIVGLLIQASGVR